jgi:hypothetical protein
MEPIEFVNYETGWCSDEYKCIDCGSHGVKLYRISACSCIELRCIDCVGKEAGVDVSDVGQDGMQFSDMLQQRTDQIGGMLPAIPYESNGRHGKPIWWQYTCVPQEGINWWKKLPLRK